MSKKRRLHRPPTPKRRRRLRSLAIWALVAAVAGGAIFLVAHEATSGGGAKERFTAQVAETPSDSAGGQPFQGGPRLYLPVASVDLGQVPLKTVVSHAFDLRNVGDATLSIKDVQVKMLEGCWPFQPVVGSTTIKPEKESTISFDSHMMEGMGGPHLFEISVRTNDAVEPLQELYVKAVFGP